MLSKKTLLLLTNKFWNKTKQIGLGGTISLAFRKLFLKHPFSPAENRTGFAFRLPSTSLSYSDQIIIEGLKRRQNTPSNPENLLGLDSHKLEFAWLVPLFSKGSGGHTTLFRFVRGLENLGHKCVIYIVSEHDIELDIRVIKNQINEYFGLIDARVEVYNPHCKYKKTNILVCTSWITAYAGLTIDADMKVYFVQDYEPSFYPLGSNWYLAEATYRFGYYHLTAGAWLTNYLHQKYGVSSDYFELSVDKKIYYPRKKIKNKNIQSIAEKHDFKICFYGRSVTPRRCFELVAVALYLFSQKAKNVIFVSYGWEDIPDLPFPCHNLGLLDPEDLAELYSTCDVCIAPSATNLSLVAREAIACGCVLMDIDVENTSYDLKHIENSYLVKPDPQSIADGLFHLYSDRTLLEKIKSMSLNSTLVSSTWESQVDKFYNLVSKRLLSTSTSFLDN